MIGGTFSVMSNAEGGTTVTCKLEATKMRGENHKSA
jgi:hypothetical protein